MREVTGNALEPRGPGERLIVHIVNDRTPNWGGGGSRASHSQQVAGRSGGFQELGCF